MDELLEKCQDAELKAATTSITQNKISGTYVAKVVKIYDADTLTVVFRAYPSAPLHKYQIRVCYFDSAEINAKCPCERKLARMARDKCIDYMLNQLIVLQTVEEIDKYGRILGRIFFRLGEEIKDLSEVMIQGKFANEYHGQTKSDFTELIKHHGLDPTACLEEETKAKADKKIQKAAEAREKRLLLAKSHKKHAL